MISPRAGIHYDWICTTNQCLTVLVAFVYNIRQSTWQQRCNRLHGLDPSKPCRAIQHFQYKLWQFRKAPVFIRTSARTQSAHIDQMSVMNQFWTEAVLIQNTLSFDFSRWWLTLGDAIRSCICLLRQWCLWPAVALWRHPAASASPLHSRSVTGRRSPGDVSQPRHNHMQMSLCYDKRGTFEKLIHIGVHTWALSIRANTVPTSIGVRSHWYALKLEMAMFQASSVMSIFCNSAWNP